MADSCIVSNPRMRKINRFLIFFLSSSSVYFILRPQCKMPHASHEMLSNSNFYQIKKIQESWFV